MRYKFFYGRKCHDTFCSQTRKKNNNSSDVDEKVTEVEILPKNVSAYKNNDFTGNVVYAWKFLSCIYTVPDSLTCLVASKTFVASSSFRVYAGFIV